MEGPGGDYTSYFGVDTDELKITCNLSLYLAKSIDKTLEFFCNSIY